MITNFVYIQFSTVTNNDRGCNHGIAGMHWDYPVSSCCTDGGRAPELDIPGNIWLNNLKEFFGF